MPAVKRMFAVGVLALALGGCGQAPQAGAAAVVGDRRIPVRDVQDALRDVSALTGPDGNLTQSDVLNWLILEPYVVQAATDAGLGISEHDAEVEFTSVRDQVPEPSPAGLDVVRTAVALQRLQGGELPADRVQQVFTGVIDDLRSDGVTINPRFGSGYQFDRLAVEKGTENWLAQPSASPTVPTLPQQGDQPAPEGEQPQEQAPQPTEPAPAP